MSKVKLKIKKGDTVIVIAGASKSDKPKKVKSVDPTSMRVIVEETNMVSRHTKPSAQNPDGGIIKKEAPIHISNLMIADPKTGKPTRVGRKLDEKGKLVRYAKNSGEILS